MPETIKRRIYWLPFTLLVLLLVLFISIGLYMSEGEKATRVSKATSVANQVKISLEVFSEERTVALLNVMRNWPTYQPNPVDWFNAQARSLMSMQSGYDALVYADEEGTILWVANNPNVVDSHVSNALIGQHLQATGLIIDPESEALSHSLVRIDNLSRHVLMVGRAISPQELSHGYVVAAFNVDAILSVMMGELVGSQFKFTITDGIHTLFSGGTVINDDSLVSPESIEFIKRNWTLRMQSRPNQINPGVIVAGVGIFMSFFVSWFFHKQLAGAVKLSVSQQRYKTASDAALDAIMIYQPSEQNFCLVEANAYAQSMFSGDICRIRNLSLFAQLNAIGHSELVAPIEEVFATGKPFETYVEIRSRLIEPEWLKLQVVKADSNIALTVRDVTERFKSQRALEQSEEKYRRLVDGMYRHFVYTKTPQQQFVYVSAGVQGILGYSVDTFCRVEPDIVHQVPDETRAIRQQIHTGRKPEPYLVTYQGADGKYYVVEFSDAPVVDEDGSVIAIEGIARDVTKEQALQAEVQYQANHDQLTGLMNRYAFDADLKKLIKEVGQGEVSAVMCFVDMDRFKLVNDSCGHPAGDRLLKEIANLFSTHVSEKDLLARIGGDEFCMIFRNQTLAEVKLKLDTILHDIANYRFVFEDKVFFVGASIGVIDIQAGNQTAAELIKAADNACYQAKYLGRNRYYIYQPTEEQKALDNTESQVLSTLNLAIQGKGFELFYQPIVALEPNSEGHNYEILLRLRTPQGDLANPGIFIPLAERHGLMNKIDWWVVDHTLSALETHPQHVDTLAKVAINLSGITLGDEAMLRQIIQRVLTSSIPAEKLCFEVTETTAVTNLSAAQGFIQSLRELGCRFALDDFGAGMSSFTYLKHLDVDYVKIDGSFVRNMVRDPIDHETVKAINSIAHSMGKQTIAEFVTDLETSDKLRELGVDYGQGYALGKPQCLAEMLAHAENGIN